MARSETELKPLPVAIAWNFGIWSVMVPALIFLLNLIGTLPLPDAEGWKRIAMLGLPVIIVGAVIDALAERSVSHLTRAYGRGFAVALVLFVITASDHLREEADMRRFLKGLLIVPVLATFLTVPQWAREKYISPVEAK